MSSHMETAQLAIVSETDYFYMLIFLSFLLNF